MIEQLKNRPKTINLENLSHVNSWWDKILVKNSHQIAKQLQKFKSDKLILNTDKFTKKSIDYKEYLSFSNKILEFLIQKEKKMTTELKIIQKLNKMISSFGEQAGILATIQCIDTYFTTINKKDIANKKQLAVEIGNQAIFLLYDAYKELMLRTMKNDDAIKEKLENLFATDIINPDELFNPLPSLKILFKFVNLAFRSKKIDKKTFGEIYFNTIFLNSYLARLLNLYNHFVIQIR